MGAAEKFAIIPEMGLGEAMRRLVNLDKKVSSGMGNDSERSERSMIYNALNTIKLPIHFDCDQDGLPDTVEIFKEASKTGCCRIMSADTSRRKVSRSSRRQVTCSKCGEVGHTKRTCKA